MANKNADKKPDAALNENPLTGEDDGPAYVGPDADAQDGMAAGNSKGGAKSDNGKNDSKEGFSSPEEFLSAELDRLEKENADLKDRYVRSHAEMDNLRKRTQKEIADTREFSIASFAKEMIAVADNLGRALEAIPEEKRQSAGDSLKSLIEGVEMTERAMAQALEKHGVTKISPLNERFDPNQHQAMFEIQNTEVAQNTVLQVVQDGYVIGSRCLRPAMVGVSKGGPKQAADTGKGAQEVKNESSNG